MFKRVDLTRNYGRKKVFGLIVFTWGITSAISFAHGYSRSINSPWFNAIRILDWIVILSAIWYWICHYMPDSRTVKKYGKPSNMAIMIIIGVPVLSVRFCESGSNFVKSGYPALVASFLHLLLFLILYAIVIKKMPWTDSAVQDK